MNYIELINAARARELMDNATIKMEGTDVEIIKKSYTMEVAKGNKESLTINDPDIIRSVDSINFAKAASDNARYIICKELFRLNERVEVIQSMGFKGLDDFASHMFGFKKGTSDQYARIGKYFITDEYYPLPMFPDNIPISHLLEMLAYSVDKDNDTVDVERIISWYTSGLLTDGMTTKKVREALKQHYQSLPSPKGEETQQELKEKAKKAKKVKTEGTDEPATIIDRLDSITAEEGAAAATTSLDVVEAILHKYINDNEFPEVEFVTLRQVIRSILG